MVLRFQVALESLMADVARRMAEEERGQTFVEWLGVMVVVVALAGFAAKQGVLGDVANAIGSKATSIINSIT
jgi:Flp pilus assembly pilin Flp